MSTARGVKGVITAGSIRWNKKAQAKQVTCNHVWFPHLLGRICVACGVHNEDYGLKKGESYVCSRPMTTSVQDAIQGSHSWLPMRSVKSSYAHATQSLPVSSASPTSEQRSVLSAMWTANVKTAERLKTWLGNLVWRIPVWNLPARKKKPISKKN